MRTPSLKKERLRHLGKTRRSGSLLSCVPLSRCLGICERFSNDFVINSNGLYHKVIENNEDFAAHILGERYHNSPIEYQLAPFCYNVSLNEILTGRAGLRRSSCDNFPLK